MFFGGPEKVKFFGFLEESFKKVGKKLLLIERVKGEIKDGINKLLNQLKSLGCNKLGLIQRE